MTKKFKELLVSKVPTLRPVSCIARSVQAKQCLERWNNPIKVPGFEPKRALSCPLGIQGNHHGKADRRQPDGGVRPHTDGDLFDEEEHPFLSLP